MFDSFIWFYFFVAIDIYCEMGDIIRFEFERLYFSDIV